MLILHCNYEQTFFLTLKALCADENEIFLYTITTYLNIQVTRIKEVITEDEMS